MSTTTFTFLFIVTSLILVSTIFWLPYIITTSKLFDLDIIALHILPLPPSLSSSFAQFVIAVILSKLLLTFGQFGYTFIFFIIH